MATGYHIFALYSPSHRYGVGHLQFGFPVYSIFAAVMRRSFNGTLPLLEVNL
jgi:hypothetical protein